MIASTAEEGTLTVLISLYGIVGKHSNEYLGGQFEDKFYTCCETYEESSPFMLSYTSETPPILSVKMYFTALFTFLMLFC
jgi:hypothetical protein